MDKFYNLLDEPWLSVCMTDGSRREAGLLEVFENASQIRSLAETAPPSLIALYRLLLAITHRALAQKPGGWSDQDRCAWYRKGLPRDEVRRYLEHWRNRFWLFHPDYPFLQIAALATAKETRISFKPWTQISLANASGCTPLVFDHSLDSAPAPIHPAAALHCLLGFLQFVPGGLVKVFRIADKAGPLANSAAAIPVGSTLNETLCLGLHPCSGQKTRDIPAWEKPSVTLDTLRADPEFATGVNDRYTRLSRAVLLRRNEDGMVQWIRFAAGEAMEENINAPDPMVSYRAGTDRMIRLSFREGRAFWRDLSVLVPDFQGTAAQPAEILRWAADLKRMLGEENTGQEILAAGVSSDQAKILRWRIEQIALPAALLADASLAGALREEARRAEEFYGKLRSIAVRMLAAVLPDPARKDTKAMARNILDKGPAAATFFAAIESSQPRLLEMIATARLDEAHAFWSEEVVKAARTTWKRIGRHLGPSSLALCAEASAYPYFCNLMRSFYAEKTVSDPSKEVQA